MLVLGAPFHNLVAVVTGLLSVAYFLQKQKLEEMRLFRDIFKECNERYDKMNDNLAAIAPVGKALTDKERDLIIDYL